MVSSKPRSRADEDFFKDCTDDYVHSVAYDCCHGLPEMHDETGTAYQNLEDELDPLTGQPMYKLTWMLNGRKRRPCFIKRTDYFKNCEEGRAVDFASRQDKVHNVFKTNACEC